MDPRQPQHPFQRNAASPYTQHAPFQQQQAQQSGYPPGQDPRGAPQFRPDHQRTASGNNFFPQPSYPRDSAPMPSAGHSRAGSSSSIGGPGPMSRSMPPPSSPQQRELQQREQQQREHQQQQQQQSQQGQPHQQSSQQQYPPHPPARQPAPAIGPPTSFPTSRELPSLGSIQRPSGMSISSMLGGGPNRGGGLGSQYQAPAAMMPSGAPSGPTTPFTPPIHASPRLPGAAGEYDRFRRPQTPDLLRLGQQQLPQDHRATSASAGSPTRPVLTPEAHRYSTPQGHYRNPSGSGPVVGPEERREQYPGPMRVNNPNAPPARPSSQPNLFNQPPRDRKPSVAETVRSESARSQQAYVPRALGYGKEDVPGQREQARLEEALMREREQSERAAIERASREKMEYERMRILQDQRAREIQMNREREDAYQNEAQLRRELGGPHERDIEREKERERDIARERDLRERERELMREREREHINRQAREAGPFARHEPMQQYGRQYGPPPGSFPAREQDHGPWMRRPDEPREPGPQPGLAYDMPRNQPHGYMNAPGYQDPRYGPREFQREPPRQQQQYQQSNGPLHGSPLLERERVLAQQQGPQLQYPGQGPQGPPGLFRPVESPRSRALEESQNMQRGVYLGIQQAEINRKGRNSPFPQAVQGAQGPPGEPGIKSEFGKMFSGIGSGVGSIGGTISSKENQSPYQTGLRRDDLDGVAALDSPTDGLKMARQNSRGGRRRKLQDDDKEGDDSSSGRRTPNGRKRVKQMPPLMTGGHRHVSVTDPMHISSPSQPSLTPTFGHPVGPSPPPKVVPHHHHITRHHHHHVGSPHPKPPPHAIVPKPMQIIKSNAVLETIANKPRKHLGHVIYETTLTPGEAPSVQHSQLPRRELGFSSNVKPLPRAMIEGREGCTLTVRVPRVYLGQTSREEITSRRAVWGTDIYTDDSDVIAACIHSGWIQGAWPESVDLKDLDLVLGAVSGDEGPKPKINGSRRAAKDRDIVLHHAPSRGPMVPPSEKDMYVTLLILPALEKYGSSVRWGLKSREWKNTHDGVSFMVLGVKFVSGVDTSLEARGEGRRVRITAGMKEDELEREEEAALLLALSSGGSMSPGDNSLRNGGIQESFVRGDGSMRGLGMSSWWKEQPRPAKPVDKGKSPEKPAAEEADRSFTDLQPPEIEPLSSPPPVQSPPKEAATNGHASSAAANGAKPATERKQKSEEEIKEEERVQDMAAAEAMQGMANSLPNSRSGSATASIVPTPVQLVQQIQATGKDIQESRNQDVQMRGTSATAEVVEEKTEIANGDGNGMGEVQMNLGVSMPDGADERAQDVDQPAAA